MNERRLELRRLIGQAVAQEVNLDEAKRKYNQAKSEWEEFKIKAKEY